MKSAFRDSSFLVLDRFYHDGDDLEVQLGLWAAIVRNTPRI